jgi:hypothetical protein
METMDFSGTSSIIQTIKPPEPPAPPPQNNEEKNLGESKMMEFTSSIDDLMDNGPATISSSQGDMYINPTNNRVSGIALDDSAHPKKKPQSKNPLNLTDEQYTAVIAGVSAALTSSSMIQTKLASIVPNYEVMNGSIATILMAAVIFFFIMRFLKK